MVWFLWLEFIKCKNHEHISSYLITLTEHSSALAFGILDPTSRAVQVFGRSVNRRGLPETLQGCRFLSLNVRWNC